jgi:hypothetical protein
MIIEAIRNNSDNIAKVQYAYRTTKSGEEREVIFEVGLSGKDHIFVTTGPINGVNAQYMTVRGTQYYVAGGATRTESGWRFDDIGGLYMSQFYSFSVAKPALTIRETTGRIVMEFIQEFSDKYPGEFIDAEVRACSMAVFTAKEKLEKINKERELATLELRKAEEGFAVARYNQSLYLKGESDVTTENNSQG